LKTIQPYLKKSIQTFQTRLISSAAMLNQKMFRWIFKF